MKRELAALDSKSPTLDSIGRTTRSSKKISGVSPCGISKSLVYKRVKRSAQVENAASNGVLEVSETSEVVGHQNGIHDAQMESVTAASLVLEDIEIGKEAGFSGEVLHEAGYRDGGFLNGENALLPRNGNGLVKNVLSDDGNATVVNGLNANGGTMEVNKVIILEEKSPLKVVNGNAKNSSVDNYPRRFTRSALKSKVDAKTGENVADEQSLENPKEVTNVVNGEICKEIVLFESQTSESNGEMKNLSTVKSTRRLTRSALKSKVDANTGENVADEQSQENPKEVNGEICKEIVLFESQTSGSNGEMHNLSTVKPTRRVTRSASKAKVEGSNSQAVAVTSSEDAECGVDKHKDKPKLATPRRKLEMKMSKQISLTKIPTNVVELFETGLLEGCPVYYDGGKGIQLNGRIRGVGILCSCGLCRGCKVIPPSLFEIHACKKYKRAAEYIFLENGRSLINILKTCKTTRLNTLEATVQNAIGPLPEKKFIVCQNCKEQFSSMDAECSEPVCSTCVMSNVSPVGPVYSPRKQRRSTKAFTPKLHTSEADLPSDLFQDTSQSKSIEKSADVSLMPRLRSGSRVEKSSETKASEEIVKSFQGASIVAKNCSIPVMQKSLDAKGRKKRKNRSFKASLSPKLSKSIRSRKFSPRSNCEKAAKRLCLTPKPLKTPSAVKSSEKKTSGKITRKDLRLHKLVFEDDVLPDGTELGYYARGQKLLDGFKKGFGIFCNCCDTVVSASQFEAHAGCASRRKPYCYIYTSNGVSLHELSVNLIKDRRHSSKYNDDLCSICADGGNLLLCDGCPRAFHTECASLPSIPNGKWYCKYCENMFEREKFVAHNANALAAGRVSGVDSIEEITKRSIRIVNNVASEISACILCRGYDFCKSGFGPRTIILCDQCEKEYHVGCLKDHNMADLTELPDGKWFCSTDCGRIENSLEKLLVCGVEKLPESLVDVIQKKNMQNVSDRGTDLDVSWRLLCGKIASPETRPLLSQAVAIFHESFAPIIDVVSGHDLIPAMVYGRNVGGQEYGGMYCAVLTVNSVVVSAGIFRIFGPEVAELPLVATSSGNHGKGYFQTLFACIEKLLGFLKVKTLVLPAAEEAGSIWTDRFGFKKMTLDQLHQLKRNFWSLVRFQGTSMLHKAVPEGG